jgi:hypothetical protein
MLQAVGAAVGVQRGLQQRAGRRRRLRKPWFLASFAVYRWLDSPLHSQDRRLQAEVARQAPLLRLRIS